MRPEPRYQPGEKIAGQYQVHEVKMGGMGEVYLCLDLKHSVPIALKTFQQRHLTELVRLRRVFQEEVLAWVGLERHPNIVHCVGLMTLDNQPFVVLEWIVGEEGRGTDLRGWLRHGPLELRQALDFTVDICRGLIHADVKQPGIVHRDLKPENVLVAQGRVAKITDFGLAQIASAAGLEVRGGVDDNRHSLVGEGGIVGTPAYMPPEQWRGDQADVRADIYAVGCILFEMLIGRQAFAVNIVPTNAAEYRHWLNALQTLHESAERPTLPTTIPEPVIEIVENCLARKRRNRHRNAADMLEALTQVYQRLFSDSPLGLPSPEALARFDYFSRGITYFELKQYEAALADLDRAITLEPSDAEAYAHRGTVYSELQKREAALEDFDRAIALDPDYAFTYLYRGRTYAELQQYEAAIDDFNRAIDLRPDSALSYSSRGSTYKTLERYEEAIEDCTRAIALDPGFAQAYLNRGSARLELQQYEAALADFDRAITLDPLYYLAYYNRGACYARQREYEAAIEDFTLAVDVDPMNASAYHSRGGAYTELQQFEAALQDYNRAIALDPTDAVAYLNLGVMLGRDLNRLRLALPYLEKAAALGDQEGAQYASDARRQLGMNPRLADDPVPRTQATLQDVDLDGTERPMSVDSPSDGQKGRQRMSETPGRVTSANEAKAREMCEKGLAQYENGKYKKAIKSFSKAIRLNPLLVFAYTSRGSAYEEMGKFKKALADWNQAVDLGLEDASLHYNLGNAYGHLGRHKKALANYSRAIKLEPEFSNAYTNRGALYRRLRQDDKALADYDRAIQLDATDSIAYRNRGNLFLSQEQHERALTDYQRAIELDPSDGWAYVNLGVLLGNLGQLHEALECFEEAARLGMSEGAQYAVQVRRMLG